MTNRRISEGDPVKTPYTPPQLIVHGNIEQITLGEGWGIRDIFVYGLNDPIGKPPQSGTGS